MDVIAILSEDEQESNWLLRNYILISKTEFERRGYRVRVVHSGKGWRAFLDLLKSISRGGIVLIDPRYSEVAAHWKNRWLLKRCSRRGARVGIIEPLVTGLPVDMAAYDYQTPDLHRNGGRIMIGVLEARVLPEARKIADAYPELFRILNLTKCLVSRLEDRMEECDVLIGECGEDYPSALMLKGMATGKIIIGPGSSKYWEWTGEEPSLFYPQVENPSPEEGVFGVPFYLDTDQVKEDLEKILLILSDPVVLQMAAETGRSHVRRHHCSEKVIDHILSGLGIIPGKGLR